MIEILRPGPLATVQDLGRPGYAHLGVGRSGAADRTALRLANRLVGNPESAAGVEVTFGGFAARFRTRATIALTGAPTPATIDLYGPVEVGAGTELVLGSPPRGVRTYLAVRGGVDGPLVFGSRSTDLLGGLGPAALEPGSELEIGTDTAGFPLVDLAVVPDPVRTLTLRPGPRADWFTDDALETLLREPYEVTAESNRVGVRLSGERLQHWGKAELPTEGMVEGSIQVPPSGLPIVMLADHPVTGGYPVIAVLTEEAIGAAAQARPGDTMRFTSARTAGPDGFSRGRRRT